MYELQSTEKEGGSLLHPTTDPKIYFINCPRNNLPLHSCHWQPQLPSVETQAPPTSFPLSSRYLIATDMYILPEEKNILFCLCLLNNTYNYHIRTSCNYNLIPVCKILSQKKCSSYKYNKSGHFLYTHLFLCFLIEKATHLLKDLYTLANVKISFCFYEYFHFGLLLSLLKIQ